MSEQISKPNAWRSLIWPAFVAGLMVLYMAMNAPTPLRPLWQLMDAGMSMKPADDLRVLLTGIDAFREAGFRFDSDLLQKKSVENGVPLFNYPYAWFLFAYLPGVTNSNFLFIAALCYIMFGATLIRLFRNENAPALWWVLATLLSPSVVLLCERANCDIIVFCMVAWASLALARNQRSSHDIAAGALFTGAAFLKLFPIAAIAAIPCSGGRRRWILFACCVGIFAVGAVALRADIARVRRISSESTHNCYGAKVLIYELLGKVDRERHAEKLQQFRVKLRAREDYTQLVRVLGAGFQLAASFMCAGCAAFGWKNAGQAALASALPVRARSLFVAGAGVYCATFIANNNWSYRLVFLLLCIPVLVRLARAAAGPSAAMARVALVVIVIVNWATPIFEPLEYFLLHNALHWLLAGGLAFLIGAHFGPSLRALPMIEGEPSPNP